MRFITKAVAGAGLAVALVGGNEVYQDSDRYNFAPLETIPPEKESNPQSTIYTADSEQPTPETTLAEFGGPPNKPIELAKLDPKVRDNIIEIFTGAEDQRFFEHNGVDRRSLARALREDLKCLCFAEGASTIDEQTYKLTRRIATDDELKQSGGDLAEQYPGPIPKEARRLALKTYEMRYARAINVYLKDKYTKELAGQPGITEEDITRGYKLEILEDYANNVYMGRGAYGVEAGAQAYFGKTTNELTYQEIAFLAGQFPGPRSSEILVSEKYLTQEVSDLYTNFLKAKSLSRETGNSPEEWRANLAATEQTADQAAARSEITAQQADQIKAQAYLTSQIKMATLRYNGVINKLHRQGALSDEEAADYRKTLPRVVPFQERSVANYSRAEAMLGRQAVDMAIAEAVARVNENATSEEDKITAEDIKSGGYEIRTTYKVSVQKALGSVIANEQPLKWDKQVEIAAVVQAEDGAREAVVGSKNPKSQLNMVTRPTDIGSRIKPMFYAAGYETGLSPDSEIPHPQTLTVPGVNGSEDLKITTGQSCKEFRGGESGDEPVCTANNGLAKSDNIVAGQMAIEGSFKRAVEISEQLGGPIRDDYTASMILGTEMSPDQITTVYNGLIANQGESIRPHSVLSVRDKDGTLLYEYQSEDRQNVVEREISKHVAKGMVAVAEEGTVKGLIQAPKNTVAAKTGTSSNSGSLGVTVVAGDKKHGIRTTTISVTNRDNIDTIPNSTYKGSSSMAAVFNKFFKRTRSDEALNLLSAYDQ